MKGLHFSLLSLLFALLLSACAPSANTANPAAGPGEQALIITDMLGRRVSLPGAARRVVAIGPGALRLYVYAGNLDYLVGIEQTELGEMSGRPYMLANPALASLPVIGLGGPNNAPDAEKLLTVKPDIILSTYANDTSAADELQARTGIPVLVINYGGFGITTIFGDQIQGSLRIIGEAIGDSSRAGQVNAFLQQAREDLQHRTQDIPESAKPTVYVGGLGARGAHGIESTQGQYALLEAVHARNVVDETGQSGSVMIDKEKLLEWNPDVLFIDQNGSAAIVEDYQKNPEFYRALAAVQNGRVYSLLPYNNYSTNLDTAIANAYFIGKTLYPEAFADIEPEQKADEIYRALLGQALYEKMLSTYQPFGRLLLEN